MLSRSYNSLTTHNQREGRMKKTRVAMLAAISALILLAGVAMNIGGLFAGQPQEAAKVTKAPKAHPLHLKKIHNKWKVAHPDSTTSPVTASKGDSVVWMAMGSDVYIQFGDSTVFGTYNAMVQAGGKLTLTVQPVAKPGRYPYAVFCLKDKEFATADSPPVIIIE